MISIEQLQDLPYMTFPVQVRDALQAYPLKGIWSDEGDYYVNLEQPEGFINRLKDVCEDLPDLFDERLMEIIRDHTGGHQFHRFASGDILVNEQGLRITSDEFIPADMYDIPRKETVHWTVRPPEELLVPGARVRFDLIASSQIGSSAVQTVTWAGPDGQIPPAFEQWAEELKEVFSTLGPRFAGEMLPDIPDRLAGIPELTGSWAYASLDGIFALAAKMDLPVELGGSKSDSWTSEVPFEFIDLNP